MSELRAPAVAGLFYPVEPRELRALVAGFLEETRAPAQGRPPKALVLPHAGYVYSGPVAASGYARLSAAARRITRVVLLGPSHRVAFEGLALTSASRYGSPLGAVPVDLELQSRIRDLPGVLVLDAAHATEHSLEVHLPFLQILLAEFSLLPIVVGRAPGAQVAAVLEAVWGGPETLVVISSDLSHYHDYDTARALDMRTSQAIERGADDDLDPDQACGYYPLRGLLRVANALGLHLETLDLRNSGDTAGGRDRVVGYGAYALFEPH